MQTRIAIVALVACALARATVPTPRELFGYDGSAAARVLRRHRCGGARGIGKVREGGRYVGRGLPLKPLVTGGNFESPGSLFRITVNTNDARGK